jgi:hypothetical protein
VSGRAAAAGALAALAALGAAGCESTQSHSARLKRAAAARPQLKAFVVTRRNPDVTVASSTVIRAAGSVAVVFELRSRAPRPSARLPLSFELRDADGRAVYRNDAPGLDASLVEAPSIPARGRALWVDDQVTAADAARTATARIGLPAKPVSGRPPEIRVEALKLERDTTGAATAVGKVHNASPVEQRRLVVFVVARRGVKVTAGGRAIVPRLKPGATARFTAFLIGDLRRARLHAEAPPTIWP